jgi:hypothetical protein
VSDEMLWNYGWPNRPCERCSDHPGCHNYGCQIKAAWAAKYREAYGQTALDRYQYPHSDAKIEEWKRQAAHDAAVARKARDRYERKWIRVGAAIWLNGGISLDTVVEMLEAGVLKSMPRDTIRERIKSVSRGS